MVLSSKYHIVTSDNLCSEKFIATHSDNLLETDCRLLRDLDFSVLANEKDTISLRLYYGDRELISFNYIANKEEYIQSFTNDDVRLHISFNYQLYSKKHNTYMLFCPSFTIIKHPYIWSKDNHYGQCGQSCPCCRAHFYETLGACPLCA